MGGNAGNCSADSHDLGHWMRRGISWSHSLGPGMVVCGVGVMGEGVRACFHILDVGYLSQI